MPAELAARVVLLNEGHKLPFGSITKMVHRGPLVAERKLREWIRKDEEMVYSRLKDYFLPLMRYAYTRMFEREGAGTVLAPILASSAYMEHLFELWTQKPEKAVKDVTIPHSFYNFSEMSHPKDYPEHALFQKGAKLLADLAGLTDPEEMEVYLNKGEIAKVSKPLKEYKEKQKR